MEAASVFRSSPLSVARPTPPSLVPGSTISAPEGVSKSLWFGSDFHSIKRPSPRTKKCFRRMVSGSRSSFVVRACSSSDSAGSAEPIAPLQLESPVGQFLSQILASDPHLVPAAVEQQLDQLQTELDAEKQKDESSASGTDLVLYRRIAEVKANERRKALEEILYALIVQKFMDANVSLVPSISPSHPSGRVDTWPSEEEKLKQLHSPEAYEMIQNHLALILGNRLGDSTLVLQISKLMVGQVYAASVMYGYFLKRVDQRFQLEKAMKTLREGQDIDAAEEVTKAQEESFSANNNPESSSWAGDVSPGGFGFGLKPSRLRSYVMSLDGETLQSCSMIRSKEAVAIIEKHTEALFGRSEIAIHPDGTIVSSKDELIKIGTKDELIMIGVDGLRRLVLEAVTFGSFVSDVETYVESRYHFVSN